MISLALPKKNIILDFFKRLTKRGILAYLVKKNIEMDEEAYAGINLIINEQKVGTVDAVDRRYYNLFDMKVTTGRWVTGDRYNSIICKGTTITVNVSELSDMLDEYVPFYNKRRVRVRLVDSILILIRKLCKDQNLHHFVNISAELKSDDISPMEKERLKKNYTEMVNYLLQRPYDAVDEAINEVFAQFMYAIVGINYGMNSKRLSRLLKLAL